MYIYNDEKTNKMEIEQYHLDMMFDFLPSEHILDLRDASLRWSNLSGANLSAANLSYANLRWANLSGANLSESILSYANLSGANLSAANLSYANLRWSNLSGANLSAANLSAAILRGANLIGANLSATVGLLSASAWLKNFETTELGVIVYKAEFALYRAPDAWQYEAGNFLTEVVNPNRTDDCGCGVNFATLDWVKDNYPESIIWKCLIHWQDLPSVVVPYNTDGKARCERLELLEVECE